MPLKKNKTRGGQPYELFGWHDNPAAVDQVLGQLPRPVFGVSASSIMDSGKGRVVLLHKVVEQVMGRFPLHLQTSTDCVSHGWGLGIDVHKCVRIFLQGENEEFKAETATELIYAGARVEVGRGQLGRSGGAMGAWAAKFVTDYGTLARMAYPGIDLTTYSGALADRLGMPNAGVPDNLEPLLREHPVKTTSLVQSYEEARDAIANGYPVPVCSMQGFSSRRDADGFAAPQGTWPHCMCFISVDDDFGRPGLLCVNSWGPTWISGPTRHGQPEGSFWVDAEVCTRMLSGRQMGGADSFSISGLVGYPSNVDRLDHNFFWN